MATQNLHFSWNDPTTGENQTRIIASPAILGRDSTCDLRLNTSAVSRQHTRIEISNGQITATDLKSTNGTYVNGKQVNQSAVKSGDLLTLGPFDFTVILTTETPIVSEALSTTMSIPELTLEVDAASFKSTVRLDPAELQARLESLEPPPPIREFPPPIFDEQLVPLDSLEFDETTYLTIGGGLGSFAWVDHLLIYGAKPEQVTAIGVEEKPYGKFSRFAGNSQIPDYERLRSDSGSTPDNIWGWPGYAVREIVSLLKNRKFKQAAAITWQIFTEPVFADTYTPIAGHVFASVEREAQRISWDKIWQYGRVRAIRKTDDGRYIIAYSQSSQSGRVHKLIVAQYVHIAVGYPGIQFLPDLQNYRQTTKDFKRVVNAYEQHDHVYEQLAQAGGTVLIRGRGIVASRILQRLSEARAHNAAITIIHLMRSPRPEGQRYGAAQRIVEYHFEYQPYNWPKATVGGDLRFMLEDADDMTRDQLLNDWGGTTTAKRQDWREILQKGSAEGWYQIRFGNVRQVESNDDGRIATVLTGLGDIEEETRLIADYIIDATGLNAKIEANPLLKDLVEHYTIARNPKGKVAVLNDFEIEALRHQKGRVYMAGNTVLGGSYAPVDSFIGLQYAAQRSVDSLAEMKAPNLRKLSGFHSINQWFRWARGVRP